MTSYVNSLRINRIAKSKTMVGKKVKVQNDNNIYFVSGRTQNGYVILNGDRIQDVNLVKEVETNEETY